MNDSSRTAPLTVRIIRDDLDCGWVAECVDLPGCVSDGATKAEAINNLRDAISEARQAVAAPVPVEDETPAEGETR